MGELKVRQLLGILLALLGGGLLGMGAVSGLLFGDVPVVVPILVSGSVVVAGGFALCLTRMADQ